MATFRAVVKGNRGSASRLGHSNIKAEINGWNIGVKVYGWKDKKTGEIHFDIYKTGGSKGATADFKIKTLKLKVCKD